MMKTLRMKWMTPLPSLWEHHRFYPVPPIKGGEPGTSQTGKFPEPLGTVPEPLLLTGSRRKIGEEAHHWREGNVFSA
jgi:hypothetical protein